jgi:diguanylate cyclase (GGDEF)-like protein
VNDKIEASAYLRLIEVGIALSGDKNIDKLLQHILLEAKSLSCADAGTVYLHDGKDTLKFSIVLNDTLGLGHESGQRLMTGESVCLPEIQLFESDGSMNLSNIASCAVHRGDTIVVDNAHENEEFDFSGTQEFDERLGYRSTSFLTIPLRTMSNRCLGVLQLLNAKAPDGQVVQFPPDIIPLIEALASQASVSIENRALLDEQEVLKKQLEQEVDTRTEQLKDALTRLSEAHIILKEMNTIDAVTGIRNRQYFDDALDQEWRRAKRQGYDVSMLLLDIDHFKKVNDTYGHLAGDECLASVAKEIDQLFNRPSDVVARYGGEEFAVVLPYVSSENAKGLAEQLRQAIDKATYAADGNEIDVTVSIGVATISPREVDVAPRDLIGWADSVLYEAKAGGRNRVCQHLV